MSASEWRLWGRLRDRQAGGHKFRRQVPIGPYFADFCCLSARLIVEVDGDHHAEQQRYDAFRDAWLKGLGYRVLRFGVDDLREIDGVLEVIVEALPPPTNLPPSPGGGRPA